MYLLKVNSGKSLGSTRKDKPALGDYTGESDKIIILKSPFILIS